MISIRKGNRNQYEETPRYYIKYFFRLARYRENGYHGYANNLSRAHPCSVKENRPEEKSQGNRGQNYGNQVPEVGILHDVSGYRPDGKRRYDDADFFL